VAQRTQLSGKLVILGIVGVALTAAGTSWWFRYSATRRTAEFYGLDVRLIRDAPIVELMRFEPSSKDGFEMEEAGRHLDVPTNRRDISTAAGLTHLRAALLEDRSYIWPPQPTKHGMFRGQWQWILVFRDDQTGLSTNLVFARDWQSVTKIGREVHRAGKSTTRLFYPSSTILSCKPIADGLAEMLEPLAPVSPKQR
jgi:hypothetical protein